MKSKIILIAMVASVAISCKGRQDSANQMEVKDSLSTSADSVMADSRGYIVAVGDLAPDFEIEYADGKKEMLSSLRGKVVMLQFTASWCGVCRKEMPFIEKDIWQKHKNNSSFALIGIDFKETPEVAAKFAKDIKITYPLTLDRDGVKFNLFCGPDAGVTRNIIINKEGRIIMLTRLYEEEEFAEMVKLIDAELLK